MVEFTGVTATNCGGRGDPIYNGEIQHTNNVHSLYPRACLWFTSECDGFTKWSSSIDVDCCHLESILSVWSKPLNSCAMCCFCLVPLHISVSTTGCVVPHNIASNGPILLDARHLPPSEEYFSGFYKPYCLQ